MTFNTVTNQCSLQEDFFLRCMLPTESVPLSNVSALSNKMSVFAFTPLCHLMNEPISCMQKAAVGIGVQELLKMGENQSSYEIMTKAITGALKSFAFVNSYFCDLREPETMEFCRHAAGWYGTYYFADYLLNA